MEGNLLDLTKNYVELYSSYFDEIDDIKKSLKIFTGKKNNALKKGIFAPLKEVYDLEVQILGSSSYDIDENENNKTDEYIESKKEEISENSRLAGVLNFLDTKEEDNEELALENDMVQIYRFSNGDMYIGRLFDGKMMGIGSYIFAPKDGEEGDFNTEYIGSFSNGVREGRGMFIFANGNEYIGSFENNKSSGIGRMKYINGDEYLGNWSDGKKEGLGIYTWSNGYIYIGDFKDSKMDGNGSCFNSKGELVYDGEWKMGQIHGKGRYIWSKNKWYEGEFNQGEKDGYGIFYIKNNPVYEGTWKHDEPSIFNLSLDDIVKAIEEQDMDSSDGDNVN